MGLDRGERCSQCDHPKANDYSTDPPTITHTHCKVCGGNAAKCNGHKKP